jgi:hypothetical protein
LEKQACQLAMVNIADKNNDNNSAQSDGSNEKDVYKPAKSY